MNIQIDSREKARAITRIVDTFNQQGIHHFVSKLYVGDYMSFDQPRLIIDRKQNLIELCGNVCQGHERFKNELLRAQEAGIQLIILCEHGGSIKSLEDVIWWINPRATKRAKNKDTGRWETVETKAISGQKLYKTLSTMQQKYGCQFLFCDKKETGKRILELLGGDFIDL